MYSLMTTVNILYYLKIAQRIDLKCSHHAYMHTHAHTRDSFLRQWMCLLTL